MSAFDDLKKQEESWVKANRKWLIAIAVAFLLGLIIPHIF